MAEEISGDALDEYLAQPDCPQCGSDDVVCTDRMPDGMGGVVTVWYCKKCGHTWTERG
jgi:transposase-like protein